DVAAADDDVAAADDDAVAVDDDVVAADAGADPGPVLGPCEGAGGGGDPITTACTSFAPTTCEISDFAAASYDATTGFWGEEAEWGGSTFEYRGAGNGSAFSRSQGAFVAAGDVVNYAGWGFDFAPCVDASSFDGIQVTLRGTVTGP